MAQWLSCLVPFIALDLAASHVLPCTMIPAPSQTHVTSPDIVMDPDIVKVGPAKTLLSGG